MNAGSVALQEGLRIDNSRDGTEFRTTLGQGNSPNLLQAGFACFTQPAGDQATNPASASTAGMAPQESEPQTTREVVAGAVPGCNGNRLRGLITRVAYKDKREAKSAKESSEYVQEGNGGVRVGGVPKREPTVSV